MKLSTIAAFLITLASLSSHAETANYDVEGMHCGSCAAMIKEKLCKMDGLEKCDVSSGKITLISKDGIKLDTKKVQDLVSQAGEYKISEAKPAKK